MCILGAAPFAACGFFSYHGMTAEQLLWAWIKSEILMPKRLIFKSDFLYYQIMQPAISEGCKRKRRLKNHIDKTDDFKSNKSKPKRRNRMTKSKPKTNQKPNTSTTSEARH